VAIKLGDLAVRYGCELHGDPDQEVVEVGTLDGARAGAISFLANPGYRKFLAVTDASAVILNADAVQDCEVACLVADDPYAVYAAIAAELYPQPDLRPGVHKLAAVGDGCEISKTSQIAAGAVLGNNVSIGERVYIGPNCVVGDNSSVGADTRLLANITVYQDVIIGERCIVHGATVIGSDGFGIAQTESGWLKVPQVGGVVVADDVEIGAGCTIDRGAIDSTRIGPGVKLDNQVHIAHNVVIGEHTAIAGQVGISGSTTIGARCVMGGQVAISGHLQIADDVFLQGRSVVTKSITKPGAYSSVLSVEEAGKWRKLAARFKRQEETAKKLKELERLVKSTMDGNGSAEK
jgi:UDP-3-O-[3-hydroxymyristoyl] glucosamine N-acyltransferase